jgi:hypothetical protein
MYLVCVGPPSSDEHVDQVSGMRNDEGEASEGMLSMENDDHHLWDHCL